MAHCLAEKRRKVLLLDIDPQAHAGTSLGHMVSGEDAGVMALLSEKKSLSDVLVDSSIPGLSLVPASRELTAFEIDNSVIPGSETCLSERLTDPVSEFDYVIIDPPPTVGLLTVMALAAARTPAQVLLELSGSWDDSREADEIIRQIRNSRTKSMKLKDGL